MKLGQLNKVGNEVVFEVEDTTPAYVNALRRMIINETPTMAIAQVEFQKNSSTMYDEMLAHRLGLVVLKTDLKSYNLPTQCTCNAQGCAKCQIKLVINVKGPATVTAKDLESQDPKIVPVYPGTLLVTLMKGQELQLVATAQLGLGKDHAKWSPGLCYYTFYPTVTVNNASKKFDEFKEKYPAAVFDKSGKISKEKIIELDLVDACDGVCDDIVKVEYDKTRAIVHYEAWGALDAKKTIQAALDGFTQKTDEFIELVKAL